MRRATDVVVTAVLIGILSACNKVAVEPQHARILLNSELSRPTIDVVDAPAAVLQSLESTSGDAWTTVLRIAAGPEQQPVLGQYAIVDGRIRFTPMAPFRRGRPYLVTFAPPGFESLTSTVTLPAMDLTPSTVVTDVFPTSAMMPANQLRLHLQFSAPMDPRGIRDFVRLVDESGSEVKSAFMSMESAFWNEDRTRYTLFIDPAAHALSEGRTYTLVLDTAWRDGNGLPLKQPYRRTFKIGPPDTSVIDTKTWKLDLPASGSSGPLVIIFPEPLDHEQLAAALIVQKTGGKSLNGHASIGAGEMTWTFVPDEPWQAGQYTIGIGPLEDLAGNGIGHAFDPQLFDRDRPAGAAPATAVPFTIR